MRQANEVSEDFLHRFKAGDLVDVGDVRRGHRLWSGPHKLLVYKIDQQKKDAKPAAHIVVDLGQGKKLDRWLIVGDQQVIRKHIPEEQKQRIRARRVPQEKRDRQKGRSLKSTCG